MAWTAPTTRTAGELITASIWNTDLVENLKYLKGTPALTGFTTSGQALVGVSSARSLGSLNALLQVETAGSTYSQFSVVVNRNDTGGAGIVLGKSRGTTTGSNTIVADADNVGFIRFNAADGVDLDSNVAQILAQIDGTPGSNDTPGRLTFWTTADGAASVTERLRITQAGNLAIAATAKLHFDGVAGTGDTYIVESAGNTLSLYSGGVEAKLVSGVLTVSGNSATYGFVGDGSNGLGIAATHASGAIRFYSGGTSEGMRLSGNDLYFATTTSANLGTTNSGILLRTSAAEPYVQMAGTATSKQYRIYFYNGNGLVGNIATNGSATEFNTSSDKRLKHDLGLASDLSSLRRVEIHDFLWLADRQRSRGVFAQDTESVFPRAVSHGTDDRDDTGRLTHPWTVDYSKFVPDLIVGWQQHDAELSALRARVAQLEGKLAA